MGRGSSNNLTINSVRRGAAEHQAIQEFIFRRGNVAPPDNTELSYRADSLANFKEKQKEWDTVPDLDSYDESSLGVEVTYKRKRDKRLGEKSQSKVARAFMAECFQHASQKLAKRNYIVVDGYDEDDYYGDDPTVNLEHYREDSEYIYYSIVLTDRS